MLYEEFTARLPEGVKKPTADEYDIINLVYDYHPSISQGSNGRDQIAMLYSTFGMRIIMDMQETAKRSEEIRDELVRKRREIYDLEREYKELTMR